MKNQLVKVMWKNEDTIGSTAVGPVFLVDGAGYSTMLPKWHSADWAFKFAKQEGVEFEEA